MRERETSENPIKLDTRGARRTVRWNTFCGSVPLRCSPGAIQVTPKEVEPNKDEINMILENLVNWGGLGG